MSGCVSVNENKECWSSSHVLSQPCNAYGNSLNHFNNDPGGACTWNASVDVEDLAQLFSSRTNNKIIAYNEISSSSKIQPTKHHRVFRRPFNSTTRQYNNVDIGYTTYSNQSCINVCDLINPSTVDQPDDFNDIATINAINISTNTSSASIIADGIPCTEAQWLNCPITNCPFFDSVGADTSTPSNTNTWNELYESNWDTSHDNVSSLYNEKFSFNECNFNGECYPNYCPFRENTEEQQSKDFLEDYLSNEKRKEKSRDAARYRRSRETDIFADLAASLPMELDEATHLDKASVMRLAIAYLKVRSVVNALDESQTISQLDANIDQLLPRALDGFVLMLSSNGDMIYLSENICDYLGVSQMEMMGQNIYDYSHPCDHDELKEYLLMKPADITEKRPVNFFLRLKCTLTNKGRKVNLKSASYKVIHCVGRPMITQESGTIAIENDDEVKHEQNESSDSGSDDTKDNNDNEITREGNRASLVIVGCPIPHPSNIEVPLGRHTFLSKHNLNMKFTYVDERLSEYLGWSSNELIGKSVFEFHHALDNSSLDKSFKALFSKGQCETMAYRFLGKKGGYAWVVTQATLIHCVKQRKPLSVVCVNHILSELECENEVFSVRQLEARSVNESLNEAENIIEEEVFEETLVQDIVNEFSPEKTAAVKVEAETLMDVDDISPPERTLPLTVTATIFKERLPETKKEISFQGKPILDYELPERLRGPWLQSVTRNFFTSATAGSSNLPIQESQLSSTTTCRQPPQTATASIFAPRTEDMNKGFLTFSEDQPGLTMLKDEPEDLTHLAPTPGDVCVPLEDSPFLSDMLDEFILSNENYCSLLSPSLPTELPIVDLTDDTMKECHSLDNSLESDPFFYRDTTTSPTSDVPQSSPTLLSPILDTTTKSQSIDSFCSSESSRTAFGSSISEDDMLMLSINDVIGDEELALRAPYIPMSDQDEALQLLISNDMVMWGPTQPPDKRSKWSGQSESTTKDYLESSLAKLLKGTTDVDKRISYGANSMVDPVQVLGQTSRRGILERPNKRLHGPTSPNAGGETKRMRYSESKKLNSSSKNIAAIDFDVNTSKIVSTTTTNGDLRNRSKCLRVSDEEDFDKGVRQQGQTLLLQQLMSDRVTLDTMAKTPNLTREESNNRQNDEYSEQNQQRKRQSNSVLMNLLVSGCDETYVELPTILQEKLQMPLTINVDDNCSSPWLSSPYLTNYTFNPNSPSPKKLLVDSINYEPLIDSYNISSPLYNNEFNNDMEHNVGPPLSPKSELLKVLSE